jgi:uncharacterized protein (TIGR02145 family)
MKTLKYIGAAVLGAMMLTAQGCLRDSAEKIAPERGEEVATEMLTVNLRIPEIQTATRAVDETALSDLKVYMFTWDEDPANQTLVGDYNLVDENSDFLGNDGLTIKPLASGNGMLQFSVPKPADISSFEIVILANSDSWVIQNGDTWKEESTKKNLQDLVGHDGGYMMWNFKNTHTEIPMWGESGQVDASSTDAISINMIRAVAKMSLTMADPASDIADIDFVNFAGGGFIASDTYSSFTPRPLAYEYDDWEAYYSSLEYSFYSTSLAQESAPSVTLPLTATGDFYVFEAPAVVEERYYSAAPESIDDYGAYLLVNAKYEDTYYWYRINFVSDGTIGGTAKGDYLPIVRNYNYRITINAVNGPGYEFPEEAAATKNSLTNLDYTTFVVSDVFTPTGGGPVYMAYDGNYFIAYSREIVQLFNGVGENYADSFEIYTNFNYVATEEGGSAGPDGWTATAEDDWFELKVAEEGATTVNGAPGTRYTVKVIPLSTGNPDGTITISAGRLTSPIPIIVDQGGSNSSLILRTMPGTNDGVTGVYNDSIRIVTWNGEKILMGPEEFQIAAVWNTPDDKITVTNIVRNGNGVPSDSYYYSSSYTFPFSSAAGYDSWTKSQTKTYDGSSRIFNIKPTSGTTIVSKSVLTFKNSDGIVLDSIGLSYRNFYMSFPKDIVQSRDYSRMWAGGSNTLVFSGNVRASIYPDPTTWPTALTIPSEKSFPIPASYVTDEAHADPFAFRNPIGNYVGSSFTNNGWEPGVDSVMVRFIAEATPYLGADVQKESFEVPLYDVLPEANSYIAKPNSMLAAIPTSNLTKATANGYNGDYKFENAASNQYKVKVLWSDRPGVIKYATIQGTSERAGIFVKTGVEGNAVIVYYFDDYNSDTEVIIWSWHIWVTADKDEIEEGMPGHTDWMDRNLGALAVDWGSATSPTAAVKNDVYSTMFYQWGRPMPIAATYHLNGGATPTSNSESYVYSGNGGIMDITASVQNPMQYYANGSNGFVDATVDMTGLWGLSTTTKSVYDPCPPGWRVPKAAEMPYAGVFASEGVTYPSNATTGKIDFGAGFSLPLAGSLYVYETQALTSDPVYLYDDGYIEGAGTKGYCYGSSNSKWSCTNQYGGSTAYKVRCIREGVRPAATISVSPGTYTFEAAGGTGTDAITVTTTNNPSGIAVSQTADTSWLTPTLNADGTKLTLAATANDGAARTSTVTLTVNGGATATVVVTQREVWGGDADILYIDSGGALAIGRWDNSTVTVSNMVFTQFGSVIGFTGVGDWNNTTSIKFNPTATVSYADTDITNYGKPTTAWAGTVAASPLVSDPAYHNDAHLAEGRGDICKLVGLTSAEAQARVIANTLDEYKSGWRLPKLEENRMFIGIAADNTTSTFNTSSGYYTYSTTGSSGTANPYTGTFPENKYAPGVTLPAAGYRSRYGEESDQGTYGRYWSSTVYRSGDNGYRLGFSSSYVSPSDGNFFATGFSVRCVSDE